MVIEEWKKCGIANKFPTFRSLSHITGHSWLVAKQADDEAEGLWRIYDSLYDLTDFIDKHPGGSFWLRETKGTDITELFESHHLSSVPGKILETYKVREASKPRNYTLTLHDDGFYKTLKRRVQEKLKTMDQTPKKRSDKIHLSLLVCTFLFAIASARLESLTCCAVAGAMLCWLIISAHNYFHRRDNWQMYTWNLCMLNFCSWRISHALSHHIYPNTYYDLELSTVEPLLCWVPNVHMKTLAKRYLSWIVGPLLYPFIFPRELLERIIYSFSNVNILYWHDLLPLTLPLAIYIGSGASFLYCLQQWISITMIASLAFCIIGLNAAHHDPKIYHEGDATRADRDWGLFQVDTIIDRNDTKGSHLLVLTHFGDHALHHLFPTLDHGILPQLYPVLYQTLDEFNCELREQDHLMHIVGQYKQLLRIKTNPKPPGSGK